MSRVHGYFHFKVNNSVEEGPKAVEDLVKVNSNVWDTMND